MDVVMNLFQREKLSRWNRILVLEPRGCERPIRFKVILAEDAKNVVRNSLVATTLFPAVLCEAVGDLIVIHNPIHPTFFSRVIIAAGSNPIVVDGLFFVIDSKISHFSLSPTLTFSPLSSLVNL